MEFVDVVGFLGIIFGLFVVLPWSIHCEIEKSERRRLYESRFQNFPDEDSFYKKEEHSPMFNIDGTPMNGSFDTNGNAYGVTEISGSSFSSDQKI